ncbi:MAG TPA: hypothetical protein DEV98_09150 [Clostridiales bacterium]|nr:hypothetical protein [Clostridiales bacterium]
MMNISVAQLAIVGDVRMAEKTKILMRPNALCLKMDIHFLVKNMTVDCSMNCFVNSVKAKHMKHSE